jgi:hypothetical protein
MILACETAQAAKHAVGEGDLRQLEPLRSRRLQRPQPPRPSAYARPSRTSAPRQRAHRTALSERSGPAGARRAARDRPPRRLPPQRSCSVAGGLCDHTNRCRKIRRTPAPFFCPAWLSSTPVAHTSASARQAASPRPRQSSPGRWCTEQVTGRRAASRSGSCRAVCSQRVRYG